MNTAEKEAFSKDFRTTNFWNKEVDLTPSCTMTMYCINTREVFHEIFREIFLIQWGSA